MKPSSSRALKSLAGLVAGAALFLPFPVNASEAATPPPAPQRAFPETPRKPPPHRAFKLSTRAQEYYRAVWGVDSLRVSRMASGNLIRFNYRVIDPAQAAPLVDRRATPVLVSPRAHAMLSVPVMEKIGPLRQIATLKAGQEYWITFSNKGNLVRAGDHVNVVIDRFHADGLVVE